MSIDTSGLEDRVRAYARERAEELGDTFIEHLRAHMPRRTGALADSAKVDRIEESLSGYTVSVVVESEYAAFQNYGTGIYGPLGVPITPRRARVLVFDWPAAGGIVFARHVRGTEPTHFWERTLDEWPMVVREVET